MRKTKKILTCLLVIAMLPTVAVKWQSTAEANSVLFTEDFESYTVGTIIEAASDQSTPTRVGNIDYQLRAGDKLEIAQENGNKYLKITRASTSSTDSHIKYYFGETFSANKYSISYDFKPDVHNRYFSRLGSLIKDPSGVSQTINTYSGNAYVDSGTNASYYVQGLVSSTAYTGYAKITQVVDLTKSTDNYSFTAGYQKTDGTAFTKTVTRSGIPQSGITGLIWSIRKHTTNSYNGGDDASAAAVYRIDNIVVKLMAMDIVSTNVPNNGEIEGNDPFTMTFNEAVSAADVTLKKNGIAMSGSDYTVTVSGSTVSVVPTAGWIEGSEYTVDVGEVTAVSGTTPYSGTTYTLNGSSYLFIEDFEDYAVGTIAQNATTSNYNPGTSYTAGIGYKLLSGDKIAIAQDASGNKYLEITRGSTSSSDFSRYTYFFPQIYSGKKYAVSYNFMTEEHNQYFRHFGSLWKQNSNGTRSGVIKQITSYEDDVYYDTNTPKNPFYHILDTSKYTGSAYSTITQTVDFTNLSSSALKTVLPDATVTEHSVGSSTAAQGTGLFGLLWDIQVNSTASYNGGSDHTTPSVYRVDNIKVKAVPQKYVSASVADNATGVAVNSAVTLTFTEPVASAADLEVVQNGKELVQDTDYTVSVSGNTVTVTPSTAWGEGSEVIISGTVTGTNTDIAYSGRMLTFCTAGDFVLSNVGLSGNAITADVTNNTAQAKSLIAIGAQFDSNGRFTYADKVDVTVGSGETENITVEFITSAPINELYIWDGLTNINALTKKRSFR